MEKIPYLIVLIIFSLVIIAAVVFILKIISDSQDEKATLLERACLELIKNYCDDGAVVINSKSFVEICERNNLKLDDCKKFCGC
ncbi:MAG: hypothetical protein QW040_00520 [Candidatus Aenigmatarchaeota archaeon]